MYAALRAGFFILVLLLGALQSKATHIFGADFYYEHVAGINYKVTLVIYGDCKGDLFPSLSSSSASIELLDNNVFSKALTLNLDGPGTEVTPVCPAEKNNTQCKNPNNLIPGVTRFVYSGFMAVPYASANWKFRFSGRLGTSSAGRSNAISNIDVSRGSIMVMEAELNNLLSPNSSPRFTTIPTPFYCINIPQQYNQGAVDPDNDSLYYSLAPALEDIGTAVYKPGFSPSNPVASTGFSFNPVSGQLNFTPDMTQLSTVVNKVTEYRNGVAVGTAMREMTFVILATCANNAPPTGAVDTTRNTYSGIMESASSFIVCAETGIAHFVVGATDADGDSVEVAVNGLPAGATAVIQDNNTPHPKVIFDWHVLRALPGTYNFYITYKDNGCPFSSQQTQAYTIRIVRPNQMTPKVLFPTECAHRAYVSFAFDQGVLPRNVVIKKAGVTLYSFVDLTGSFTDSLETGTYDFTISSPGLNCITQTTVSINDSGIYPYPPIVANDYYCKDAAAVALTATAVPGGSIFWYDVSGNRLAAPPVPSTATAGVFRWFASTLFKVCESRKVPDSVYVTPIPVSDFSLSRTLFCTADTIDITFTGSAGVGPILEYRWGWGGAGYLKGSGPGPWKVNWSVPGIKTISLKVIENKCPGDSITKQIRVKPMPGTDFSVQNICLSDTLQVVYLSDTLPGQTYAWDFNGATTGNSYSGGPFLLHWNTTGLKKIFLRAEKEGCTDTASRYAEVYEMPVARILTVPAAVCLGDKIYLEHAGNDKFKWTPNERLSYEPDDRVYTHVSKPTTYMLTVTNGFGCSDSAAITYDRIEPCCNFSYPTAFTPNNDGRNDRFHVVTYGNDEQFSLRIFNRWGQCVYHSGNPKEGWDGTLNGKECEMGTYFYLLTAKCLTGHEESQKGEFTLIR